MEIRKAQPEEAASLSAIALESKAHWGYTAETLGSWLPQLTVTSAQVAGNPTYVATADNRQVGFYMLCRSGEQFILEHLWVRPAWIGQGIGAHLLRHALELAQASNTVPVRVVADPNAAGFYARQGGVRVGALPAPLPGALDRELPIYEFGLPAAAR